MIIEIVLAAIIGMALGGGGVILWKKKSIGKAKLCVLGMKQTGKTLFFNALRGIYDVQPDETALTKIGAFKITLKSSRGKDVVIRLKETLDISGSEDYIASYYRDLIFSSTHVIYFCNIYEYLNDEMVRKEVNARLDHIKRFVDESGKTSENVFIVLSYGDKVENRKEALRTFIAAINGKPFASFARRIAVVNMTKKEDVEELIKSIFYVK